MTLILYGIFMTHLIAYKDRYINIGITFAVTYMMKRLIKAGGNKDHAELIGLGGYTLTIGEFIKLMGDVKRAGMQGANSEEANKIVGGLLGKGVDLLKDLITK